MLKTISGEADDPITSPPLQVKSHPCLVSLGRFMSEMRHGSLNTMSCVRPMDSPWSWRAFIMASVLVLLSSFVPASAYAKQAVSEKVVQFLKDGEELASHNHFAEAEVKFKQAQLLEPRNIEVLSDLAKVEGRLGEYSESAELFAEVVRLSPKIANNHLNYAIALADSQNLKAALDETNVAIRLAPQLPAAHRNAARILIDLGQPDKARDEFKIALRLAPTDPDTFYYWALLEHDEHNLPREQELLKNLVRLRPEQAKAWFLLARNAEEQSDDALAISSYRRALEIDPNNGEVMYRLSRLLRKSNPAEAQSLQKSFLEGRKNDATLEQAKSLGNKAYVASAAHDWHRSITLLQQALDVCGNCSIAAGLHKNLGLSFCQSGNTTEGENELRESLAINPNDRDAVKALQLLSTFKEGPPPK